MIEVRKTEVFETWFTGLKDRSATRRIQVRIDRMQLGNPGDIRPVGEGVSEMRIDYGPVYRVYFIARGDTRVVLLAGGDKRTQRRDVQTAIAMVRQV